MQRAEVSDVVTGDAEQVGRPGGAPATAPAAQPIWAASVTGTGTQTLLWKPTDGDWRVVVMNPDRSAGVSARISIGGRFPDLGTIGWSIVGGGAFLLLVAGGLLALGVRRRVPRDEGATA